MSVERDQALTPLAADVIEHPAGVHRVTGDGVTEATVKTHVAHVFSKLAVRDRAQAVVVAYETGLIQPGG